MSWRIAHCLKFPQTLYDKTSHEDPELCELLTKYDPEHMGEYITDLIPCLIPGAKKHLD